jgi:hypothetical protein
MIKNNEKHDIEFYHNTLKFSSESFIPSELKEYFKFINSNNISYSKLITLMSYILDVNIIECLFNIPLINKYNINIEEIINLKQYFPIKNGEYFVIYQNELDLPGVQNVLTPIYTYKNITNKKTYSNIEYKFETFKFNKNILIPDKYEVYTEAFFTMIQDRLKGINYNIQKVDSQYQVFLKNKIKRHISKYIDNYLNIRIQEIINEVVSCEKEYELKYLLEQIPLFCYKNEKLSLEKLEYVQFETQRLLKEYNVISSS